MKFIKLTRLTNDGNSTREIYVRKSLIRNVWTAEGKYARHKTNLGLENGSLEVMEELTQILNELEEKDEKNFATKWNDRNSLRHSIPLPVSSHFESGRTNTEWESIPDATGTSSSHE